MRLRVRGGRELMAVEVVDKRMQGEGKEKDQQGSQFED